MTSHRARTTLLLSLIFMLAGAPLVAQQSGATRPRPEETEIWEPVPPVVTPGDFVMTAPPSDAIVLFDGTSLDGWVNARSGAPAGWTVSGGTMTVNKATGDIATRRRFRSYQLHLEWRVPEHVTGEGQARGNSGVYLAWDGERREGYELQILDSYQNATYVNGMAGSIYKQSPPLVNASRRPGEWQTYDVVWTAPTFDDRGSLSAPARVTVFYNGVLVQDDFALRGETVYRGHPTYHPYDDAPIMLQAHGDPSPPISFRNIWVREIEAAGAHQEASPMAAEVAIAAASRAFSDAYVRGDTAAIRDLYTADGMLLAPGREVRGRDAIVRYFAPSGRRVNLTHAMESSELRITGDVAVDVGTWSNTWRIGDGDVQTASERYLVVWRRGPDGRWRIAYDMWHRPGG